MKFSHEYLISQVAASYEAINAAENRLKRERENLEKFLLSQDYIKDNNVFVHPAYYEMRERFVKEEGRFLHFPSWAVVILP